MVEWCVSCPTQPLHSAVRPRASQAAAPWLEAALLSRATSTKPFHVARPRVTFTKPKEDRSLATDNVLL